MSKTTAKDTESAVSLIVNVMEAGADADTPAKPKAAPKVKTLGDSARDRTAKQLFALRTPSEISAIIEGVRVNAVFTAFTKAAKKKAAKEIKEKGLESLIRELAE